MLAALVLAAAGIGTLTFGRLAQTRMPAEPPVADLSGAVVGLDLDSRGAGWALAEGAGPKPIAAYWTADSGRSWHRALELGTGSVGYLRSFGATGAVLTYFPAAAGFKQGNDAAHGLLYVTTDGGRRWSSTPLPGVAIDTTIPQSGMSGSNPTVEFTRPQQGRVYLHPTATSTQVQEFLTSDGGLSWRKGALTQQLPPGFAYSPDGRTGIVGVPTVQSPVRPLPPPAVLVTHDAGRTSTQVSLPAPPDDSGYPGFGADLEDIRWSSNQNAGLVLRIALGSQGTGSLEKVYVYTTADAGAHWSGPALLWSGRAAIEGVPLAVVLGTSHWVVVAGGNVTVSTGASGGREVSLPIASPYQVTQIDFPDATVGFLAAIPVGSNCAGDCPPVILNSKDGGLSWQKEWPASAPAPSPSPSAAPGVSLLSVSFVTTDTGWLSLYTSPGPQQAGTIEVFRTEDSGRHWSRQLAWPAEGSGPPGGSQPSGTTVFFTDKMGYVVGPTEPQRSTLYRTVDGGTTWKLIDLPGRPGPGWYLSFPQPEEIWMLANVGAATGHESGEIYHSSDAGDHWSKVTTFGSNDESQGISFGGDKDVLSFRSATQGWLLGWVGNGGLAKAYATNNGGRSWSEVGLPQPSGLPVPGSRDSTGMYVGVEETLLAPRCSGASCVMPMSVCVGAGEVGPDGIPCHLYVYRSPDGGVRWTPEAAPAAWMNAHAVSVEVVDASRWVVGTGDKIWTTSDQGRTWTALSAGLPSGFEVGSLRFLDGRTGWELAGPVDQPYRGFGQGLTELLRTDDFGKTWTRVSIPAPSTAGGGSTSACGDWSGPAAPTARAIADRYGEIRNCFLVGSTWVMTTLGKGGGPGAVGVYLCADAACLDGAADHPIPGWTFYPAPYPGGVTVLAGSGSRALVLDDGGHQITFDLNSRQFSR